MIVAYALEYDNQYDEKEISTFANKLLSPFYLIPYIYFNDSPKRPYTDKEIGEIRNWLSYENIGSKPQERTKRNAHSDKSLRGRNARKRRL